MKAVIFLGGNLFRCEVPKADLYIAADRGWDNAVGNGIKPDIICGDMDSVSALPDNVEAVCVPTVKDDTDTQLAVRLAAERGADEIVLLGQLSGRGDHTLSAIFTVEAMTKSGIKAELRDDRNRVRYIENQKVRIEREYRYFGIISLGETQTTITGARYPLDCYRLVRENPFAVSNEVDGDFAEVTVSGDGCVIIESN